MRPRLQSPLTGNRRAQIYGPAQLPLLPPAGGIPAGSAYGSRELLGDLRALIDAGLIKPAWDGRTVRYALVDAHSGAPTTNGVVG